ncbi:MAG: methyltransferase domain-containing protein [Bacteroidia bacterium]|nr:methyltransferase domain-containing protein [Bacteroidia bacterium]
MEEFRKKGCRYCDSSLGKPFLELGSMALANSFVPKTEASAAEFECPLSLSRCENCGLIQLADVVPAEMMFTNYLYVSSTTATFRKHFAEYAKSVKDKSFRKENLVAVDIGSNDGLLVSCFVNEGMKGVGVEPAVNLSSDANKNGVPTINRYFDHETVLEIISKYGKADIITANNVFAHIDDSQAVCRNANDLLSDTGMFVIEFPYLVTMVEEMLFDMIYHEHLSYIALISLKFLMNRFKMEIFDVDYVSSHGGSLRVFIQKEGGPYKVSDTVEKMMKNELEKGYDKQEIYTAFAHKVNMTKDKLVAFVKEAKAAGKTISGYGAPAKGNTLINFCNFDDDQISYIVDDNPLKQNMLAPGSKIPVMPGSYLNEHPTDYVIIFAWNFAKEIIAKIQHLKEKNVKFIIPLPEPSVV